MADGRKRTAERTKAAAENTDLAPYYFHQGTSTRAYEYLGAHAETADGKTVWTFRVWAPNADSVSVVGDFFDWSAGIPMRRSANAGVWELTAETSDDWEGMRYKYKVIGRNGTHLKADPYGTYSECLDKTASILHILRPYPWHDRGWRIHRKRFFTRERGEHYCPHPVNI